MRLKAALNGNRAVTEHPTVPVTPEQLARAARDAVEAGAFAFHLHPRDAEGKETLAAGPVAEALRAVREACLGIPVGISSGYWIQPDTESQLRSARAWTEKPDFVSVNWHEPHAEALATELLRLEIGVEAGIWSLDAAHKLLTWPEREHLTRVLVELVDEATTLRDAYLIVDALHPLSTPILLHGEGPNCWATLQEAARLGLLGRIGLEDTLTLPDGTLARDNAELIKEALRLAQDSGVGIPR